MAKKLVCARVEDPSIFCIFATPRYQIACPQELIIHCEEQREIDGRADGIVPSDCKFDKNGFCVECPSDSAAQCESMRNKNKYLEKEDTLDPYAFECDPMDPNNL